MLALSALILAVGVIGFIAYGVANSEMDVALTVLASCVGAIAVLWVDFFAARLFYFAAADAPETSIQGRIGDLQSNQFTIKQKHTRNASKRGIAGVFFIFTAFRHVPISYFSAHFLLQIVK